MTDHSETEKIIVYGHSACPGVGPVKGVLKQAEAEFEYVNIHQDLEAAARVRSLNNGYESVPTLVFPDGSSLTEPSAGELLAKLKAMGYEVGLLAWLIGNIWSIFLWAAAIFVALRFFEII